MPTFFTAIYIESDLDSVLVGYDAVQEHTAFFSKLIHSRFSPRNREMRKEAGASKMTWT